MLRNFSVPAPTAPIGECLYCYKSITSDDMKTRNADINYHQKCFELSEIEYDSELDSYEEIQRSREV